jgi:hypothetical protein
MFKMSLLALAMLPGILLGQSLQNIKASLQKDSVIISYDLVSSHTQDYYTVEVYSSHDNFSNPLKAVSGDVGPEIKPGLGKTITWMVKAEMGPFKGSLTFELRATPYLIVMPFEFTNPAVATIVKKGKSLSLLWAGGVYEENISLQLMQKDNIHSLIAQTKNTGSFTWQVPKSTPKGDYRILLTAQEGSAMSKTVTVKKKGGFGRFMLLMIVGGGAYYYFTLDPPPPPPAPKLPLPIDPN